MIYLATASTEQVRDVMRTGRLGQLAQPDAGNRVEPGVVWAADNGCFAAGDTFDEARWLAWLDRQPRDGCLFAVAPDVLCDPEATWARSAPLLPVIRSMGYPAALVAQDGVESLDVDWDAFDVLFIGGSTAWKMSAPAFRLAIEARRRGKRVHVGRVNSRRRYLDWSPFADSCDGTYLAFGPDTNLPKLLAWTSGSFWSVA